MLMEEMLPPDGTWNSMGDLQSFKEQTRNVASSHSGHAMPLVIHDPTYSTNQLIASNAQINDKLSC